MLPDRVSNPRTLTYESGALPIALRGPAIDIAISCLYIRVYVPNETFVLVVSASCEQNCKEIDGDSGLSRGSRILISMI